MELRFRLNKRDQVLTIPAPGRHLSPALITGLNALLPDDQDKLWFADHGPPIAIVTRATIFERDELQRLTGVQLSSDPPSWWTAVAPLPATAGPPPERGNTRRTSSPDEEISDYWERVPAHEGYLLGVEVMSGEKLPDEPFDWLVSISAREYFRDDPSDRNCSSGSKAQCSRSPASPAQRTPAGKRGTSPGKASGEALCQAAATVLDELADRMRAEYNAMFGED